MGDSGFVEAPLFKTTHSHKGRSVKRDSEMGTLKGGIKNENISS